MEPLIYSSILLGTVLLIICFVKIFANNFLLKKGEMACCITLIPVNKKSEQIEYTVRSLLWSESWGKHSGQCILLVLIEFDEEIIEICKKLCEEYSPVFFCNLNELEGYIKSPVIYKECIAK